MQLFSWLTSRFRSICRSGSKRQAAHRRRFERSTQHQSMQLETLDSRVLLSAITVTRQDSVVPVDEGRIASNYGYISTDGAAIAEVTASVGTINFDAQWQLWQWTYNTTNGPAQSQSVQITATDINGETGTTSFTLTVHNVSPTVSLTTSNSTTNQGITFESGNLSFADQVVDFSPGPNTAFLTASAALGAPTGGDNSNGVTLGNGGSITLRFTDNTLVDQNYVANGVDLYLFDLGLDNEEVTVEISEDGTNWIALPNPVAMRAGEATGIDIASVATADAEYHFVRITDVYLAGEYDPFYVGLDLDAVGVVGAPTAMVVNGGETAVRSGVFRDPGADIVTLTASIGSVTQSGSSNGDWNWSYTTLPSDAGTHSVVITATDSDGGVSVAKFDLTCVPQVHEIDINVKGEPLNLNGLVHSRRGCEDFVQVAIYTTSTFNARDIKLKSVVFAGARLARSQFKDVDGDGDPDLVAFFKLNETNLLDAYKTALAEGPRRPSMRQIDVSLTAETKSGVTLRGEDTVRVFANGKALRDLLNSL